MPKIAVLLVNYNDSRFIIDWVRKMSAQMPEEIIVVDDHSTDKSVELLQSLRNSNALLKKIKVVQNDGVQGPYSAFVCGCRNTNAEFVSCWSCDDLALPGYIESMREAVASYPLVDIFTCNAKVIRDGETYSRTLFPFDAYISPDYLVKIFKSGNAKAVNIIGSVVRKDLVLDCWGNGGSKMKANFDAMFAFYSMFDRGFVNLGKELVLYRSFNNSFGAVGNPKYIQKSIALSKIYFAQKSPLAYKRITESGMWSNKTQMLQQIALKSMRVLPRRARLLFNKWFYSYDYRMEKL